MSGTFLAVLDAAPSYDPRRGEPVPWLLGIAARVVAGQRRRAARDHRVEARAGGHRLLDDDDYARIEAEIDAERLAGHLRREVEALSGGERELFLLVCRDGLGVGDAARVLGISAIAARARLARVRRRLRAAAHAADARGADAPAPLPSLELEDAR